MLCWLNYIKMQHKGKFTMDAIILTMLGLTYIQTITCATDLPVFKTSNTNITGSNQTTTKEPPTTTLKIIQNCELVPTSSDMLATLTGLASSGNKLVILNVSIIGQNGALGDTNSVSLYRPYQWIIATSLTGQSILMLKEYFEALSVYTLGLGVARDSLTLSQQPADCFNGAGTEEAENTIRLQLLNHFGASAYEICNAHVIKEGDNDGRFAYTCCKGTSSLLNGLQCSELKKSVWIELLFIFIILLQIVIMVYSPLYMPDAVYEAASVFQTYVIKMEAGEELALHVKKIDDSTDVDNGFIETELQTFTHLNKFNTQLQLLAPGKVHKLYVNAVDMCVRDNNIVAEGDAPVSLVSFLHNFFVRCKLRDEITSVGDCCTQDMFLMIPGKLVYPWYKCLSGFMTLMMLAISSSPLLFRIWFYYEYEEDVIENQIQVFDSQNLSLPYTGNIISYLSPTHYLFQGIYILLINEIVFYTIMPDSVKEKLKFVVRKCFRDMRDTSKLGACGMFASHMVRPLKRFGVVGCLILPIWLMILPLYLIVIALEVLPLANLSVRLLVNLIFYITKIINPNIFMKYEKKSIGRFRDWMQSRYKSILVINYDETNSRWNQLFHTITLIMTFVTVWVFLLLVIECIAFYVECTIYALIGFIIYPRDILKFVSVLLLVGVYAIDSFGGVHGRYAAYSAAINTEVQGMIGDRMTTEASKSRKKQQNTAFSVPSKNADGITERMCLVSGSEGFLKWKAFRLALFLDTSDTPYIPKSFLFQMSRLNYYQCPGLVHLLYLKAFLDFSLILVFLAFVFIVIFAFGQAQDISSDGQAIAALGSGFLPLILRKFLFQSQASSVDKSNLNWKNMFANAVQRYAEGWNIVDIYVVSKDELDPELSTGGVVRNISEINMTEISTPSPCNDASEITDAVIAEAETSMGAVPQGNVDLIVKYRLDNEGKDKVTFYVKDVSATIDDVNTDPETVL